MNKLVNGTHALDASVVRRLHLWGRKEGYDTATIHDALFMNINEIDPAIDAVRGIYADFSEFNQIQRTLDKLREEGLPEDLYQKYMKEAEELGYFTRGFTREELLRRPKPGEHYYGWGP